MVDYQKISTFINKNSGRNVTINQLRELEKTQKMALGELEVLVNNENIKDLEQKLDQLRL